MPSVSAAVFRGDELVWQEALGLADVEARVEATPDTQYRVGSITKTFTAVGDPAAPRRGRALARRSADADTSRRARTGRRSVGCSRTRRGSSASRRARSGRRSRRRAARSCSPARPQAEHVLDPGAYWHYSNLAFALLGEIVARAPAAPGRRRCRRTCSTRSDSHGRLRPPTVPLRAATSSSRTATRCGRARSSSAGGAIGQLWSTTGDLAALGRVSRGRRRAACSTRRRSRRCTRSRRWSTT